MCECGHEAESLVETVFYLDVYALQREMSNNLSLKCVHRFVLQLFIEDEEIFYWTLNDCARGTMSKTHAYEPVLSLFSG